MNTPTESDLARAIIKSGLAMGLSQDECRTLIIAECVNGILRPNCPSWLIRTQYFLADHGKLYELESVARATDLWLEQSKPEPIDQGLLLPGIGE